MFKKFMLMTVFSLMSLQIAASEEAKLLKGILKSPQSLSSSQTLAATVTSFQLKYPEITALNSEYLSKKSAWWDDVWPRWLDRNHNQTQAEFQVMVQEYQQKRMDYVEVRERADIMKRAVFIEVENARIKYDEASEKREVFDVKLFAWMHSLSGLGKETALAQQPAMIIEEEAVMAQLQAARKKLEDVRIKRSFMYIQPWHTDCLQSREDIDDQIRADIKKKRGEESAARYQKMFSDNASKKSETDSSR